jgi:xanthine/uracil/vitamin C permease (AzgA family)
VDQILVWLANPLAQAILLNVGGWILKTWPQFVNKAIPLALLIVSILGNLLAALWPNLVPAAGAAELAQAVASVPWWKAAGLWGWQVALPVVIAVGLHSSSKNVREWASLGNGLLKR